MKLVLFVVFCASTALCAKNETICNQNEEYMRNSLGQCPDCPAKCTEKGIEQKCDYICHVSGCFCKLGFYQNEENNCVPYSECKTETKIDMNTKCPENEEYLVHIPNCQRHESPCHYVEEFQNKQIERQCKPGCFCEDGFFRNPRNSECVKHEDCPAAI